MLKKETYDKLINLTDEELKIKNGQKSNIEDLFSDKLLAKDVIRVGEFINIIRHIRFIETPLHKHDFLEIAYVFKGKMVQKIEGKDVHLKEGELIFLNQHILHEIKAANEDDVILNFVIKPKFFDCIFSLINEENIISKFILSTIYSESIKGEYLFFAISENKKVREILEDIIEELYNDDFLSQTKVKLLIGLLIIELLKNPDKIIEYSEESFENKIVITTLKYIEENYKNGTLNSISSKLNQPYYKISKLLKEFTGLTFKELLQEKKIQKASVLLKNSNYSIESIVDEVGYENASYFYKIFKKKFGISPKKYRDDLNKVN